MIITTSDYQELDTLKRVQLATSLPGAKPLCLVGTKDKEGLTNLAPFSSITHLGSIPPLIGMVTRPHTVERHTLSNIMDQGMWTLNHITASFINQAHQCSAKYPRETSEFEATGLTEQYLPEVAAPFVKESPFKFALTLEDIVDIKANNTKLIIGKVTHILLPDNALEADGSVNLPELGVLSSTALDTYFSLTTVGKMPYARP